MLDEKNINDTDTSSFIDIDKYIEDSSNNKTNELIFKEIDGVDIRTFSKLKGLSLKEVETLVKNKKLITRYQNGVIYVYDDKDLLDNQNESNYIIELKDVNVNVLDNSLKKIKIEDVGIEEEIKEEYQKEDNKENIENIEFKNSDFDTNKDQYQNQFQDQNTDQDKTSKSYNIPSVSDINIDSINTDTVQKYDGNLNTMGYLAVLAENLKVSKQEQIELLKLTQESIKRVVEATEKLVETKNTIIQEKDKMISSLEEKLALSNKKVSLVLQENEDLKILVDTLENS